MPTNLPVPSRGALRTLRNLALGTSCTVAFTAGLLTEDRRRRIHAAREVHDNAKKLKSSRKYHSAGTVPLETFEDQILRYRDESLWLAHDGSKNTRSTPLGQAGPSGGSEPLESSDSSTLLIPLPISKHGIRPNPFHEPLIPSSLMQPLATSPFKKSLTAPKQKSYNRQQKLAIDVMKLLEDPADVEAAALRFFDTFEEGLLVDESGLLELLVDVALKLSDALKAQEDWEASRKVFEVVSPYGPMEEEQFYKFCPEPIIEQLVSRTSPDQSPLDEATLRKASSIYLMKFKEKPKTMSLRMQNLGDKLCRETCRAGLFDLTLELYNRLQSCVGSGPPRGVHHLITASHGRGNRKDHIRMFRYFRQFYTQTDPDQVQFFDIGNLVLDSVIKTGKEEKAEEVLFIAGRMAEEKGLKMSSTWLLKIIGDDFRNHKDLFRTKALFERLAPLFRFIQHPQAVYGAIIQYCVEAQDEASGRLYYDQMRELYKPSPDDIRIYGHFALAKAMRSDWDGVIEDLGKMKKLSPDKHAEFSASFTPILKCFVKTHPVGESEEFLRVCLDQFHLRLTTFIMNIMVDGYAREKEIDSIARWLDYTSSYGFITNAVTFNTILRRCFDVWKFDFWEVYELYISVWKLDNATAHSFNKDTVPILRELALLRSPNEEETMRRLKKLKLFDRSVRTGDSHSIYRSMAMTLEKGNPEQALKIYERARAQRVALGPAHLNVAVKASLRLNGGEITESTLLIRDAHMTGCDILPSITAIFVQQMKDMIEDPDMETSHVSELARNTMSVFEDCGIKIPVEVVTHTASFLERRHQFREAIDLWNSMSHRLGLQTSSFDLCTLTVLLKAYIGLYDANGVLWVIKMLSTNKLVPDTRFRLVLKNTRREMIRLLESTQASDKMHRFFDTILDAMERVDLMRADWLADKKNVCDKTIMIMQNAIEVQARRTDVHPGPSQRLDTENQVKKDSLTRSDDPNCNEVETWEDSEDEFDHERHMVLPSRSLIGVAAG
jgi:hypothetical protein